MAGRADIEATWRTDVDEHREGTVEEREHPQRAVSRDQIEIGHPTSEQWVPLAKVVVDVQAGHHGPEAFARLVHAQELGHTIPQCLRAFVRATKRDLRHRVAKDTGRDRVALGVVGVQEAFRRGPVDDLGQLPAAVHGVLHAGVEALSTHRRMHMGGVAGKQDPSIAVRRGLPGRIGEPGDERRTVDPVIGA